MEEIISDIEDRTLRRQRIENYKKWKKKEQKTFTRTISLHQKEQYKNNRHTRRRNDGLGNREPMQIVDKNFPHLKRARFSKPKSKKSI